jgi:hypothetical protein
MARAQSESRTSTPRARFPRVPRFRPVPMWADQGHAAGSLSDRSLSCADRALLTIAK